MGFSRRSTAFAAVATTLLAADLAWAAPCSTDDPFKVLDAQKWVNPDDMTWADFKPPPGVDWADPSRKGSERNFNIALVTIDYADRPFVVTSAGPNATIYGNPVAASASNIQRKDVPAFYRDLLNRPGDVNRGHTLHEYWMQDSLGRYGVDLTAFGAYAMPAKSFEYGIEDRMNGRGGQYCPRGYRCDRDIRADALGLWRADVGDAMAASFELVFILSAGQDESSTWQEFGEMKFQSRDDVPDAFGPPPGLDNGGGNGGNDTLPNWAKTRYVDWSSWAAASNIWPNAGDGSSTQAESSGMGTYAHELSHLLGIGDNYNNPYGNPLRRAFAGPFSMLDRGSFNGPGGPHSRWQIPATEGGSMGSLHSLRDKAQLGLVSNASILHLSREGLATSGLVVATVTARAVDPGPSGLMGLRVDMDADRSPACDIATDVLCDGGGYNHYHVEVVDRMGADSFQPDHGVLLSKTTNDGNTQPFMWTIDANPQDIGLVDFVRPNGTKAYITMGDYRQLLDALFHAGTRSGSQFEHVDEANRLHFYVVDVHRDSSSEILSYTVAVRSLDGSGGKSQHSVKLATGSAKGGNPTAGGVTCAFELSNTGTFAGKDDASHPDNAAAYLDSDVFRLSAAVEGAGWRVEVPNALAAVKFGEKTMAKVAVGASSDAAASAVVTLTATSESDGKVVATAKCSVSK
ncbi:secreted metallopeptidase [Apiospora arundinis]|uniref:Secreted metallopeptidase n=1 Tax=Apiospora arundinis TaxID=335852 RepID=A0ABR2IEA1_9PEZI